MRKIVEEDIEKQAAMETEALIPRHERLLGEIKNVIAQLQKSVPTLEHLTNQERLLRETIAEIQPTSSLEAHY